jgi:hypothetical protein
LAADLADDTQAKLAKAGVDSEIHIETPEGPVVRASSRGKSFTLAGRNGRWPSGMDPNGHWGRN